MNNGNNQLTIDCPHCQQRFSVKQPAVDLLNTPRSSLIAVAHEKPIRCVNCGQFSVVAIGQYQIAWSIVSITEEQAAQLNGTSIIVPPTMRVVQ